MSRILRSLLVVSALAFVVWAYFAPHLTMRSMRLAAERGDAEALAAHVDFPAVREDLKAQFSAAASERIGGDGSGGWRDFGAALATAAAAPAIDALVSEASLMLLFAGRDFARGRLIAQPAPARPPGMSSGMSSEQDAAPPRWNPAMGYTDLSTFIVRFDLNDDPDRPVVLVFKRHRGLWWKLSGVELTTWD
jgi:hypothetical protein